MTGRSNDFDSSERAFLRDPLCPPHDVLLAASSDVLPEEAAGPVREHLASCKACQALVADLTSAELASPSVEERKRIRQRVDAGLRSSNKQPAWMRWQFWVPTAALLGAALAVYVSLAPRNPERVEIAEKRPTAAPRAARLPLDKPPLKLPLASAITWRGDPQSTPDQYLSALGAALAPYRKDDYAAAVPLLEQLSQRFPQASEPPFYLGVSLLHAGRAAEAIAALEQARLRHPEALADDIEWYLGVAFERTGRIDRAIQQLETLCNRPSTYQSRACSALPQLR